MKIRPPSSPRTAPSEKPTSSESADSRSARAELSQKATATVARVLAESPNEAAAREHPALRKLGHALGLGLGVAVTKSLRFVPGWNDRLVDAKGNEVKSIPGATKVGNHPLRKRYEEVVGPKIQDLVEKLKPGAVHDLLEGLADGATQAPGATYRLEARLSDSFERRHRR